MRWVRALGPILLLVAAGLLSAGVVHVVEVSTPAPLTKPRDPLPRRGPTRPLDLESFDDDLYRELQQLDGESRGETSFLPGVSGRDLLQASLGTSLLGRAIQSAIDPFRLEIRASSLYEGPKANEGVREFIERVPRDSRSWAPEPGTGLLVSFGLGALARRSLRPL